MSFTRNWDEAQPTDATYAVDIDDYNRYLRVDCSDRLKNMIYGFIAGENSLAQHFQYIQFYQQASSPGQPAADFARMYIKAVSGVSELFWRDDVNSEKQVTSGGALKNVAGDYGADSIDEDDIQLANDAYLTAKDAAGTGTVDLIKAGTNDLPTLPDSSEMASNAAPTEDEGISNKKYVDAHGVVQVVNTQSVEATTGATTIPYDDTIPQITEGVEVLSRAITPTNASNNLLIEVQVNIEAVGADHVVVALFNTDLHATNAQAVTFGYEHLSGPQSMSLRYLVSAPGTTETTFTVRAGSNAGAVTLNGVDSGTRKYGGAAVSSITITEIKG